MKLLLASPPIHGHILSILGVAEGLASRGHDICVLAGQKYRGRVEAAGARFLPLPAAVDFDDADLDAFLPGRADKRGIAALRHDLIGIFMSVVPAQYRALRSALATESFDAVITELVFGGTLPYLLTTPRHRRPPVYGISSVPVTIDSVDTAPFGLALPPRPGALGSLRNRALNAFVHRVAFRPVVTALNQALAECGVTQGAWIFDAALSYDGVFQLTLPGLEYPRRELTDRIEFLGPLPASSGGTELPDWWDQVGERPIVHVTQGTIDNLDFERLVASTIRALADEPVTVVASTGGRDVESLTDLFPEGRLPANVRVARYLPYGALLSRTSVMVTNGGFGGVQLAARHGVPLVVAGATEDKPEVAARVAWAGMGVDLRTGTPSPERIAQAVGTVLADLRFAHQSAAIGSVLGADHDPISRILAVIHEDALTEVR